MEASVYDLTQPAQKNEAKPEATTGSAAALQSILSWAKLRRILDMRCKQLLAAKLGPAFEASARHCRQLSQDELCSNTRLSALKVPSSKRNFLALARIFASQRWRPACAKRNSKPDATVTILH